MCKYVYAAYVYTIDVDKKIYMYMCTKDDVYDMYIRMCVRRQAGIHVPYHVCMCVYYM